MIVTSVSPPPVPQPPAAPSFTPPIPKALTGAASSSTGGTSGGNGTGSTGGTSGGFNIANAGSSGAAKSSAPTPQFDYMKLIVAQMQAMNPFDPSSGGNSMPEMMQAEELNQIIALQKSIQQMQASTDTATGASLLGRSVLALNAHGGTVTGTVQTVQPGPGGVALVLDSGTTVRLQDVQSINAS